MVGCDGAPEGQGDGRHARPSVVWFRGKGMLERAFERAEATKGTTFAAEWFFPGMRNATRVFAVANRYVLGSVPGWRKCWPY